MLRTLFFVLLALNAVLLAWNFNLLAPLGLPALAPAGEPERLQQQIQPERLQVQPLPAQASDQAPAVSAAPPASVSPPSDGPPDPAAPVRATASAP